MFERYREKTRRSIFFARYEASQFGATEIHPHHLLLGILRESDLLHDSAVALRQQIEQRFPKQGRTSTAIDIPLTSESKRALELGAAETETSRHAIECGHLLLGIAKVEDCFAAEALRKAGFDYDALRKLVSSEDSDASLPPDVQVPGTRLLLLVEDASQRLLLLDPDDVIEWDRRQVTRQVALGEMVESACAYHASANVDEREPDLSRYRGFPWTDLVDIWGGLNRLIAHSMRAAPSQDPERGLDLMVAALTYVSRCEHRIALILKP